MRSNRWSETPTRRASVNSGSRRNLAVVAARASRGRHSHQQGVAWARTPVHLAMAGVAAVEAELFTGIPALAARSGRLALLPAELPDHASDRAKPRGVWPARRSLAVARPRGRPSGGPPTSRTWRPTWPSSGRPGSGLACAGTPAPRAGQGRRSGHVGGVPG